MAFAIEWRHCKVTLPDLDLHFEGKKTYNFYISETVRANAKMLWETFVDFDIWHRIMSLQKLYSATLTYFLKSNMLTFHISKTVRASAKMYRKHL